MYSPMLANFSSLVLLFPHISYLPHSAEYCTFTRKRRSLSHRSSTLGILLFADGIFRQRCSRHGADKRFQARLVHQIADSSLHIVDPTAHFVYPSQNGLAHLIEVLGLISEHERKTEEEGSEVKEILGELTANKRYQSVRTHHIIQQVLHDRVGAARNSCILHRSRILFLDVCSVITCRRITCIRFHGFDGFRINGLLRLVQVDRATRSGAPVRYRCGGYLSRRSSHIISREFS